MEDFKSLAILGASSDRTKFSNKAVRAFVQSGYTVFPVNPKETEVEGLTCYPNLEAIPEPIDLVNFYLAAPRVPAFLPAVKAKGAKTIWLNPGTESDEAIDQAAQLGLKVELGCSIIAVGFSPSSL